MAAFDRLLETLRRALVHEMKRRSVWNVPPSYLGLYGGNRWTERDLLDELLLDCYAFIFVRRLQALRKQLLVRPNVDGLVFLNIRNFLHESQKRHDPLGFRIFEVLHAAVRRLLDAGTLHVLDGDPKVRNETVLGFSSHGLPLAVSEEGGVPETDLRRSIELWSDDLMPELVTAWNREDVLDRLERCLAALPESGVEVFRFRDLIEPMKDEVRARWQALRLAEEGAAATTEPAAGGGLADAARLVRPDSGYEERQSFRKLLDCTAGGLENVEGSKKTKDYLRKLWFFLRTWAAEPEDERSGEPAADLAEDKVPSDKKLGELLGIPRARIPGLKEALGRLIESCREAVPAAGARLQPSAGPAGALALRRDGLRLQTGRVAALWTAPGDAATHRSPCPGETFVFAATRSFPVEWAVLSADAENRRWWVVPVDDHPLAGHRDVTAGAEGTCRLRCAHGVWVDEGPFQAGHRTGALGEDALEQARSKRAELDRGAASATFAEREVDFDPEYRIWLEMLDEARAALSRQVLRFEKRARSRKSAAPAARRQGSALAGYALAAAFAAAAVGLSLWSSQLRRQADELARPVVVGTSATREIVFLGDKRTETLEIAAGESHVTVYLVLREVESFPAYRLELLDTDGRLVWSEDRERDSSDEYVLTLARRFLAGDAYTLRLSGLDDGRVEVLDTREIRVEVR